MPYNRDAVAQGVTHYYELLEKLAYIEESEILRPPPTGWTDEQLQMKMLVAAGRSDKVIDLVRHLPYLRGDRELEMYPPCRIVSYLREDALYEASTLDKAKVIFHNCIMACGDNDIVAPSGMIALASDLSVDAILLDTDDGIIYHCNGSMQDRDAPDSEPWRQGGKQYGAEEFLDMIYQQVKNLLLIPVPEPFPWFEGGLAPAGIVSLQLHCWPFSEQVLLTFMNSASDRYWWNMVGQRAYTRKNTLTRSENISKSDERPSWRRKRMMTTMTMTMMVNSDSCAFVRNTASHFLFFFYKTFQVDKQ